MGFGERLSAEEERRREQARRKAETASWRSEERDKHAKLAEPLLAEVDDAVSMLRSLRDRSVEVLEAGDRPRQRIFLRWVDKRGEHVVRPGQNAPGKERRRWRHRELAGWEVRLSFEWFHGVGEPWPSPGVSVFIPREGELEVSSRAPGAAGSLREYVRGGRWAWREGNKGTRRGGPSEVDREELADRTLASLLESLAEHIAELRASA
jgi:hypothetical protein